MSQILGVNDPYVIPGTIGGGGGASLPEDSAGYLYNDGSGNLSYDSALTNLGSPLTLSRTANDANGFQINVVQSRGAAGQAGDVLGTISFKGYNDATIPELIEFASIESGIAALGASDDLERGYLAFWAKANYDSAKAHPVLKIHQDMNYYMTYDFLGASGASGNKGIYIRSVAPTNTGTVLSLDASGGSAQLIFTSNSAAYNQWYLGYDFNTKALVLNNVGHLSGIGDVMSWHDVSGNVNFYRGVSSTQPTSGVKNIVFGNGATAPTAILADAVVAWCADYAAGDARLYIMGEAQTGKVILGNSIVELSAPGVAHAAISIMATDSYGKLGVLSATDGGLAVRGITDTNDAVALQLTGYGKHNATDGSNTIIKMIAYGHDGAGNVSAPYNQEVVFGVWGQGNTAQARTFAIYGDGTVGFEESYTLAHGMTGIECGRYQYPRTNTYGMISQPDTGNGGLLFWGFTGDVANRAGMLLTGVSGHAAPTVATLCLRGGKKNGTGWQAVADTEPLFGFYNYNTLLARVFGDGTFELERIRFVPSTLNDDECYGEVITGVAGESLSQWDLCYLKSDGKYWKADANSSATMPGVVMALTAMNAEAQGMFLQRGWVRNDGWGSLTIGATMYASGTSGAITDTAPSGTGDIVQVIGYMQDASILRFDPQSVDTNLITSGAITLLGQDGVTVTHNHGSTSYLVKTNVTGLGNLGRIGDIAYVKAANTVVIYNSGISGISADVEISAVA